MKAKTVENARAGVGQGKGKTMRRLNRVKRGQNGEVIGQDGQIRPGRDMDLAGAMHTISKPPSQTCSTCMDQFGLDSCNIAGAYLN